MGGKRKGTNNSRNRHNFFEAKKLRKEKNAAAWHENKADDRANSEVQYENVPFETYYKAQNIVPEAGIFLSLCIPHYIIF